MQRNVGGFDRTGRLVIGAVLAIAGVVGYAGYLGLAVGPVPQALAAALVFVVGAILLGTGYTRKCPIHSALGTNTLGRT